MCPASSNLLSNTESLNKFIHIKVLIFNDINGDIIHQNDFSNYDKIKIKALVTCTLTVYRQKRPRFVKVTQNMFTQSNTKHRMLIKFLQTHTVSVSNHCHGFDLFAVPYSILLIFTVRRNVFPHPVLPW